MLYFCQHLIRLFFFKRIKNYLKCCLVISNMLNTDKLKPQKVSGLWDPLQFFFKAAFF